MGILLPRSSLYWLGQASWSQVNVLAGFIRQGKDLESGLYINT